MIERLWEGLRRSSSSLQQRVDAAHPLDLYADFQPPDRLGLLLVTAQRPPDSPATKSISIQVGRRPDGRWSLRLTLETPTLNTVFAELCSDIIEATRKGTPDSMAATAVLERLARWRRLLEHGAPPYSVTEARGLLGELAVLYWVILPQEEPDAAIASWNGPLRLEHDFLLPDGRRYEAKAIASDADTARINGLAQLDGGGDTLTLVAVRLVLTGQDADDALSIAKLADMVRDKLASSPSAVDSFDRRLGMTGWTAEKDEPPLTARVAYLDGYVVGDDFPRLVPATVPQGVIDAEYVVRLPPPDHQWTTEPWN